MKAELSKNHSILHCNYLTGTSSTKLDAEDNLLYSAGANEETIVKIPTDLKHDPAFTLSNGFLYSGNGFTIIKDCSVEHLAATWRQSDIRMVFREELNENNPGMKMRFYIFTGTAEEGHKLQIV